MRRKHQAGWIQETPGGIWRAHWFAYVLDPQTGMAARHHRSSVVGDKRSMRKFQAEAELARLMTTVNERSGCNEMIAYPCASSSTIGGSHWWKATGAPPPPSQTAYSFATSWINSATSYCGSSMPSNCRSGSEQFPSATHRAILRHRLLYGRKVDAQKAPVWLDPGNPRRHLARTLVGLCPRCANRDCCPSSSQPRVGRQTQHAEVRSRSGTRPIDDVRERKNCLAAR